MSRDERGRLSARRRAETHKSGYESTSLKLPKEVKLFKLDKEGTRRVDILPYRATIANPMVRDGLIEEGDLYFERTFYVHRGIGPNQDTYVCPAKSANQRCPICEYRAKLAKDPESDEEQIKALAWKERQLWNVIDLDAPDEGVQLWDISYHLFGKLMDKAVRDADPDEDFEYFPDLANGKTLKLGIAEKSFAGRNFYEVQTIGFKPRKRNYDESILDDVYCLDDLIQVLPYEKLKSILFMTEESRVDDEEEEERPRKKSSASGAAKSTKGAPSSASDDDDDEDEPPVRKKRTKAPVDDDEDEPPVRKKKSKTKPPKDSKDDDFDDDEDWD